MPSGNNDHVPGIRKNEPDFMSLTDDQQREMLEQEMVRWRLQGLDVGNIPHNIFNMDVMIIALVRVMMKELNVDEDQINRYYRQVTWEKLTSIREDQAVTTIRLAKPEDSPQ